MKKTELKITNLMLAAVLPLVAVSSVLLENRGGRNFPWMGNTALVCVHIALCAVLFLFVYNHIRLHFGNVGRWREFFRKTKKQNRFLLWVMILTLVTGAVSLVTYFICGHTPFGGIHGKIGFLALVVMLLHLIRRRRWYMN